LSFYAFGEPQTILKSSFMSDQLEATLSKIIATYEVYPELKSDATVTRLMHEWAQSTKEAEHVIKDLTVENQIILDPFLGYGTFGIAALQLNRKFIGIEIDPEHFSNAQRRLSSITVTVKK
jgi:predicted RNA methylase